MTTPTNAMTVYTTQPPALPDISAEVIEQAMMVGDLGKMDARTRVHYYLGACQSAGLNPFTRPFTAIKDDSGAMVLYANKDCAEQLRKMHRVSTYILNRERMDDLYIVTVKATTPDGREEETQGIVPIAKAKGQWEDYEYRGEKRRRFKAVLDTQGNEIMVPLRGQELANAMMRAETKAKRRVTLAVCGLGYPMVDDAVEPGNVIDLDLQTGEIREPRSRPVTRPQPVETLTSELFGDRPAGLAAPQASMPPPSQLVTSEENTTLKDDTDERAYLIDQIRAVRQAVGESAAQWALYQAKMAKRCKVAQLSDIPLEWLENLLKESQAWAEKVRAGHIILQKSVTVDTATGEVIETDAEDDPRQTTMLIDDRAAHLAADAALAPEED